ncbi:MAG: hydrogenase maturation protease [Planctomycetes bacterium]|nr:hydrogenase maturation protease [Planctomycetota bacterium]
MNDIVVIGLGSPLMSDEGVGIRVVRALAARSEAFPGVDFEDMGTGGGRVLHAIANRGKAVIVDCAFMGESPGSIRRFLREEVLSRKEGGGLSLHGGDLIATLELSAALGESPGVTVIYGIQPESVSQGEELSETLMGKLGEYVDAVASELTEVRGG